MAAFATVEDFATQSQQDLSAEDTATVTWLLDGATEMIRGYTKQTISAVTNQAEQFNAGQGRWILSQIPVTGIDSITIEAVAFTDYEVDLGAGIVERTDNIWTPDDEVIVTYDSGYATIPMDIRLVCVDIAKRAFENPAGLVRDDLNTASQWVGLTAENKSVLDRYRVTR